MGYKSAGLVLLAAAALAGCTGASSSMETRRATAASIALPAAMTERIMPAGIFNLTTWQRMNRPDAPATVYIEGDGLAWISRRMPSLNPTPPDPLTLHLAVQDTAENVVYMARPCQYTGWSKDGPCPDLYWTNGRTAPEVIQAYNLALDDIKAAHRVTGFHLVGYSGGGGVAVLAAAERTDVLSIRTVAGSLDYAVFSALHGVSPAGASLDPVMAAAKISHVPQRHFIGGDDTVVPAAIFESWRKASGNGACVQATRVPGAGHEEGWGAAWPALLRLPPACEP